MDARLFGPYLGPYLSPYLLQSPGQGVASLVTRDACLFGPYLGPYISPYMCSYLGRLPLF